MNALIAAFKTCWFHVTRVAKTMEHDSGIFAGKGIWENQAING